MFEETVAALDGFFENESEFLCPKCVNDSRLSFVKLLYPFLGVWGWIKHDVVHYACIKYLFLSITFTCILDT